MEVGWKTHGAMKSEVGLALVSLKTNVGKKSLSHECFKGDAPNPTQESTLNEPPNGVFEPSAHSQWFSIKNLTSPYCHDKGKVHATISAPVRAMKALKRSIPVNEVKVLDESLSLGTVPPPLSLRCEAFSSQRVSDDRMGWRGVWSIGGRKLKKGSLSLFL